MRRLGVMGMAVGSLWLLLSLTDPRKPVFIPCCLAVAGIVFFHLGCRE